ncbi:ABC transporter ATP-binding protein [Xanthovirga aplysinae]|uniref:ABC transporter ATP-binding protein n=1 Tax=Xanthovirga aplysinae TaxID=2529853 RepID=UPI0012BC29F1|nr:ABC transporter ATP-binding protein [Xanthovirga aplysinae]MTI33247.1 ABC transporter ATP-binding protein [Xanthovirga aplysinae]
MIKLINLNKVFQTKTIETVALNEINLHIKKGEFVSIMGPSGCGKSTLLNMMGLLDKPTSGKVLIGGTDLSNYNDTQLAAFRNQKLGFIFQSFHLINDLSVIDNVELPLLYRKSTARDRRTKALAALEKVGLSHRTTHYPSQLSGGQRQRVAIARSIICEPELILADEPTGNLDSVMGNEIMNLLQNLNKEGATIVMVTHDEQMAHGTDRLIRLFDGQTVAVHQNSKEEVC